MLNWVTAERAIVLVLGCLNVGAGVLLASSSAVPDEKFRVVIVVVQAISVFIVAQIKSWEDLGPPPAAH